MSDLSELLESLAKNQGQIFQILVNENAALLRRVEQLEHITDRQAEFIVHITERLSNLEEPRS